MPDAKLTLTQRIEVGEGEVRITGPKTRLLRTLVTSGGVLKTANHVRGFFPNWLAGTGQAENFSFAIPLPDFDQRRLKVACRAQGEQAFAGYLS